MKKTLTVLLTVLIAFSLVGCGIVREDKDLTAESHTTQTPSAKEMAPKINSSTVIDESNFPSADSMIIKGVKDSNYPSGLAPLEKISYKQAEKPEGISEKKISHSHGPAADGKPHHSVVAVQKIMEKYSAFTLDTKSKEKVLYLTFDCGYEHNNLTSRVLDILKEKNVTAAFFCTLDHIEKEKELIARMIREGHIVGNHSANHPSFPDITRGEMVKEIEDTENYLRENFGYAARYFRFPAGEYNENALELIDSLGYVSVFWSVAYDDWDTTKIRGKDYAVEKVISRLHNGAVILLHSVSEDNAAALGEIIDKARAEGYTFRSLEEYGQ